MRNVCLAFVTDRAARCSVDRSSQAQRRCGENSFRLSLSYRHVLIGKLTKACSGLTRRGQESIGAI